MSGTTTVCPTDWSALACPEYLELGGDPFLVPSDPPDPGPGEPGMPLEPPPTTPWGHRVQVMLCHPVDHTPIAEIRTSRSVEWLDRFGPGEASFTASTRDPAWQFVATDTKTVRGRLVVIPDLKGLEITIGLDGVRMWSGILQQPHDWSNATVQIKADSAEAILDERTLGETEQRDYYGGRGSFPSEDLTGWTFEPHISHEWNTTSQYEGERSLRVNAAGVGGWIYGPWVTMPGQDGIVRYPVGSALVKAPDAAPVTVGVFVHKLDGTPVNEPFTVAAYGDSDDSDTTWQGPVAGKGRLLPEAVSHLVRVGIHVVRDVDVDIDLVRLQWPTLTGFPSEQDLAKYPTRILRDAQDEDLGGVHMGIVATIRSLTGVLRKLTFAHQDDHPIPECLSTVTSMEGGPDHWITAGWRSITAARRGTDRRDVALTQHSIIACTPSIDPGGQVDELRATTDIGTGSYRHVFAYDAPRRPRRRRIRKIVPAPSGLTYDNAKAWTRGQGEYGSREPFSATVTTHLDHGLRFGVGDGTLFGYEDGWAWWGAVRIGSRRVRPSLGQVVLEVGEDPVVAL